MNIPTDNSVMKIGTLLSLLVSAPCSNSSCKKKAARRIGTIFFDANFSITFLTAHLQLCAAL